ncbi:phosphoribosylamine--glycine ligase [Clostridium aestuarii]|uniref:Phosphoribosylamine--glycine ligase n=1 Tax=Clostridium aestuarii TaxID=338193 RepID=A0ABT4CZ06_9CLOT|nr:phosphoribosylamine--glycine ligase [Clostridium aestuarii]MCY6484219.1 phosphoribosylamine--glycine ligase [Clostridium aestuarii]
MKVLIVGSGGREHAIAWKISENSSIDKIYCAPGNGGTANENKCENVNIENIDELVVFAKKECIDLTIVGPEAPLVEGIVDKFKENNLKIFGPSKKAAELEGSKIYAKDFMKKYGIKTAEYAVFEDRKKALDYLTKCSYPVVIKADGLAAGKGVIICENKFEGIEAINKLMLEDIFKGAGLKIVIEEFLEGVEASILSITDGETIIPFISSEDHKQVLDGDKGPNTGGMGVVAPNCYCSDEILDQFKKDILKATLNGIKEEKMDYIGTIFFGIMITKKGVYLLEYNVRMGDPETQAVLPLMESDYVELILNAIDKNLSNVKLKWKEKNACCVTAVSKGYPIKYEKGFTIKGLDKVENKMFVSGAELQEDKLITSGGRVLSVVALGDTLEEAREKAYDDIAKVNFEGIYYRKDIGKRKGCVHEN